MDSKDIDILNRFVEGKTPLKVALIFGNAICDVKKVRTNEKTVIFYDGTWRDLHNHSLNDFIVYGKLSELKEMKN